MQQGMESNHLLQIKSMRCRFEFVMIGYHDIISFYHDRYKSGYLWLK